MSLELQDNQLAASLLGFTDAGASTWYFGSSTLAGRIARIPLVQLANGEEWFSAIGSHPRKPQRNFALFIAITFPIAPSLQIAPTSKPGGRELLVRHEGTGRR